MLVPTRHGSSDNYRYGFQGQEKDDEIKGEGNSYNFGERLLDPRVGRWWSTDNVEKPWLSPYQFAANNPLNNIDPDGNDEIHFYYRTQQMLGKDGKGYTQLTLSSEIIKNNSEHTFFMHSAQGATTEFHPFKSDRTPNSGSRSAYDANLPLSKGTSFFFGLGEKAVDDHAFLGTLLQAAPEIMEHYSDVKKDGMRFQGAVNMAGSVDFAEKAIAAEETAYAIVDGYYLVNGLSKFAVKSLAKNSVKIGTQNLDFYNKMSKIGASGKIGESYLQSLSGSPQKYFPTITGKGGRYIDQLVNGVAHESKVGYQSLTSGIKEQIAKDVELIKSGEIDSSVWHFFKSPITGKGGASKQLLKELKNSGIETVIH